jgi:fructose-bisphosphate aldolase class II
MVDGSHMPFDDNVTLTRTVADMAHACGVPVEGELGYVPGVEGEDAEKHPGEIAYTSVEEAEQFVKQTNVDFLAVSVGTVHGRMKGEPNLNFELLQQINQALNIPLVLHGGTGLRDEQYKQLIENGISKINYYTALADSAAAVVRGNANKGKKTYTDLVKGSAEAIAKEAERCIHLWGSAGKANDLLVKCTPWSPVEHVILYNSSDDNEANIQNIMAEGQRILSAIPGVRAVVTGSAIKEDAQYRYTWLVRFCHPAVIDSYRDHPDHVEFANKLFRPIAADRISIDYQSSEPAVNDESAWPQKAVNSPRN